MITVVSGLPRSGTSLVMQMLAAGGHPILCDNQRPADEDNPRGYLEFAQVKALERDSSWVSQAEGKAVKIISFLLPKLPSCFEYRVIFLRRNLREVLQSQSAMLERRGQPPGPDAEIMATYFNNHLKVVDAWLSSQPNVQVLNVDHARLIQSPGDSAIEFCRFLDATLCTDKMAACVDPDLHHQKAR
jgi:hypothetical protein